MVKKTHYWIVLCLVIASVISNLGCSKKEENKSQTTQGHYTYRLKWLFNASTLGDLWAQEKGIFKKFGLNVELKEGGAEIDALTEIELGRAHFAVASSDQIIRAASKGARPVVIAQLFRKNPLQWIYITERTKVNRALDLKGKTIGVTFGGNDETIMRAIMAKYGFTEKDLTLYAVHYDYAPFWRGEVDLWPVYRNTQGVFLSKKILAQDQSPKFVDPHSFGISFVANCLVTSEKMLKTQKDIVENFKNAVLIGWTEALNPKNEEEAVKILKKYASDTPEEILRRQIEETRKIVLSPSGKIGEINREAWENTLLIMKHQGLIKNDVDLKLILASPLP